MSLTFKFQKKSLIQNYINLNVPQLHLIIKTHKIEFYPSTINSKTVPSHNLAKYLHFFIKQNTIITTNYSIKNIYDFIEKSKKLILSKEIKLFFQI